MAAFAFASFPSLLSWRQRIAHMPIAYDPGNFWGVVFAWTGSSFPKVFLRAFMLMLVVTGTVLSICHKKPEAAVVVEGMATPYQMLVAFLFGFRLNSVRPAQNRRRIPHKRALRQRALCDCAPL